MKPPKVRKYFYLTEEQAEAIQETARELNRSASWVIRWHVQRWLAEQPRTAP